MLFFACNNGSKTYSTFDEVIKDANFVNDRVAQFIPHNYYEKHGADLEHLEFINDDGEVVNGKFSVRSIPSKVQKNHALSLNFQISFSALDKTFMYSVYHTSSHLPFKEQKAEIHCNLNGIGQIRIAPYLTLVGNNISLSPDTKFFKERLFGSRTLNNVYCGVSSFTANGSLETEDCLICIKERVGIVAFQTSDAYYYLQ